MLVGNLKNLSRSNALFAAHRLRCFFSSLPKHTELRMPALSPTMKEGKIAKWNFKIGDKLEAGDVLAEIETDKSNVGFEMQESGYLAKILITESSLADVGKPVAILVNKKADVQAFESYTPGASATPQQPQAAPQQPTPQAAPVQPQASRQAFPPHSVLSMPSLSPTMKDGRVLKWNVKVGDKVSAGDVICEIQTDKSAVGYEVQDDGYIAQILVNEGADNIDVGKPIAVVTGKKDLVAAFQTFTAASVGGAPEQPAPAQTTAANTAAPTQTQTQSTTAQTAAPTTQRTGDRIIVTPYAKKIANEKGIDLAAVSGSGPNGRIKAADVLNAKPAQARPQAAPTTTQQQPQPAAGAGFTDIPLTQMRKVIGQRLTESKQNLPHYYVTMEIKMDKLLNFRKTVNEDLKEKISVNDFIIKAASLACKAVPEANSQWMGEYIRKFEDVDVSFAVAIDSGLITPIVASADNKTLSQIAQDTKSLIAKAKEGKLAPNEYIGGTFTISNLGMFGVKQFTAIINPPQACILAVGATELHPVYSEAAPNKVEFVNKMLVTLSSDHRVVDGAVAAKWLNVFRDLLENPLKLVI